MRDLKNFTRRKGFFLFSFSKSTRKRPANAFRVVKESKKRQHMWRIVLPILAVTLAGYPVFFVVTSSAKFTFGSLPASFEKKPRPKATAIDATQSFQLAVASMDNSRPEGDHLISSVANGGRVVYTIDQDVQNRVKRVMEDFRLPYAAFVAMEPKTGKILALAGHSNINPSWARNSYFAVYPMASLFKIITAAAALEQKKVVPETVFAFRGSLYSENPKYWSVKPGSAAQQMPLTLAMGKSINPVFGRLASDVVGKDAIVSYANRFGFNQALFPGIPVTPSRAETPNTDNDLKLMGAGLGREVKISPLHAATIIAAIANGGVMMSPVLAEEIQDSSGTIIYRQNSQSVRRVVTPEAAGQLARMLSATVSSGTSRKAFHDRRGRPKLATIKVCAKTGSINGKEPEGHYSWFAAYAPAEDPKIALVALVINQDRWKIKASYLGEQALEAFFK